MRPNHGSCDKRRMKRVRCALGTFAFGCENPLHRFRSVMLTPEQQMCGLFKGVVFPKVKNAFKHGTLLLLSQTFALPDLAHLFTQLFAGASLTLSN